VGLQLQTSFDESEAG